MDAHHIAKMRANIVIEFFLIDIKIGGGIGMDHRESERDRRARDVRPPKIEHPGDRIERGEDGGIGALLLQPSGDFLPLFRRGFAGVRSEEHTSELQSLMRISYAVFCLKKKKTDNSHKSHLPS